MRLDKIKKNIRYFVWHNDINVKNYKLILKNDFGFRKSLVYLSAFTDNIYKQIRSTRIQLNLHYYPQSAVSFIERPYSFL